jgi:hypothetical protein
MADKRANLIITLVDKASTGLDKLKSNYLAVTAAVAGAIAVVGSFIKSAIDSEDAVSKLNIALKNQGIFTTELSKQMQEEASALQKVSKFSDEAIIQAQAMLTTFGAAGKSMRDATIAAINLASGLGIDLQTATMLVGKAFVGETGTLSRYGIVIDENIPRSEKFAEVLRQVSDRFGGEAQAATQTFSGQLEVLKNEFDDIKEVIGRFIIPYLSTFAKEVRTIVQAINEWGVSLNTAKVLGLEFAKALIMGIQMAASIVPGLGQAFQLLGVDIDAINAKINEQIAIIMQQTLVADQEGKRQLLNQNMLTKGMIDIKKREKDELKKIEDKAKAENEKRVAKEISAIQDRYALEKSLNEEKARNVESTLNYISSLSTAKNKQLAAIGKASAIASAYINTYAAANVALKSAPPPFNFGLAALVTAAGLANVAKIVGVQLAEGGIVMPRPGGVQATIGEAGQAEAVIPLGDDRASDMLGKRIEINVGVLVGSESSVRELARMIDKELFSLRRNNQAISFGGV